MRQIRKLIHGYHVVRSKLDMDDMEVQTILDLLSELEKNVADITLDKPTT